MTDLFAEHQFQLFLTVFKDLPVNVHLLTELIV